MSVRNIAVFAAGSILLLLAVRCCLLAQSQVSEAKEFDAVSVKLHKPSGSSLERAGIEDDEGARKD